MAAVDAAPVPPAAVAVPRALLEELAAAAPHRQVRVDPIDTVRAGRFTADRRVTYRCTSDCPACAAAALLTPQGA